MLSTFRNPASHQRFEPERVCRASDRKCAIGELLELKQGEHQANRHWTSWGRESPARLFIPAEFRANHVKKSAAIHILPLQPAGQDVGCDRLLLAATYPALEIKS